MERGLEHDSLITYNEMIALFFVTAQGIINSAVTYTCECILLFSLLLCLVFFN